jgi:hypothetical protein
MKDKFMDIIEVVLVTLLAIYLYLSIMGIIIILAGLIWGNP